jgi:hypothetical protein
LLSQSKISFHQQTPATDHVKVHHAPLESDPRRGLDMDGGIFCRPEDNKPVFLSEFFVMAQKCGPNSSMWHIDASSIGFGDELQPSV